MEFDSSQSKRRILRVGLGAFLTFLRLSPIGLATLLDRPNQLRMSALPIVTLESPPLCSYRNQRALLGPHACKERLVASSSSAGAQSLQWAVNSYLRGIFAESDNRFHKDFRLKPISAMTATGVPKEVAAFKGKWKLWPMDIVIAFACWLDYRDLVSFSGVNKMMRDAVIRDARFSEMLWGSLAVHHSYSAVLQASRDQLVFSAGNILRSTSGKLSLSVLDRDISPFEKFKESIEREKTATCLSCGHIGAVIPLVYGYPTPQLLECFHRKKLKFGGDNLIDGLATWTCTNCEMSWYSYPWRIAVVRYGSQVQESGRARYRGERAIPWSCGRPDSGV